LAERARFELAIGLLRCRFSRPVHSTALPPLRYLLYQHVALDWTSLLSPVLGSMFPFCFHFAPSNARERRPHPVAHAGSRARKVVSVMYQLEISVPVPCKVSIDGGTPQGITATPSVILQGTNSTSKPMRAKTAGDAVEQYGLIRVCTEGRSIAAASHGGSQRCRIPRGALTLEGRSPSRTPEGCMGDHETARQSRGRCLPMRSV
jgi:hypothetical protein